MTPNEINNELIGRIRSFLPSLYHAGEIVGSVFHIGSINGEEGKSLNVEMEGNNAGLWIDRNTEEGGDLIKLFQLKGGYTFKEAFEELHKYLGVEMEKFEKPKKQYKEAHPMICKDIMRDCEAWDWLVEERCLNPITIAAWNIRTTNRHIIIPAYRDKQLIMWKKRSIRGKDFGSSTDTEPILIGQHAVDPNSRSLIICEGEMDAMSWHSAGFKYAVSVPFGAGTGGKNDWIEHDWEFLQRFDSIYINMDSDAPGLKAEEDIAIRLGKNRSFVVRLPEEFKDANDALMSGVALGPFLEQAKSLAPVQKLFNFFDAAVRRLYPEPGDDQGLEHPWKANTIKFRPGECTIWGGANGSGKSMLTSQLMLEAAMQGYKSCIYSGEMLPAATLERMLRQATSTNNPTKAILEASRAMFESSLYVFDAQGSTKQDQILEIFRLARTRYGCTQMVCDSLQKCGIPSDDYSQEKVYAEKLSDLARELNIHIHLVCHIRKLQNKGQMPDKYDIKGSGSLTDLFDNTMIIYKVPKDVDENGITATDNDDPDVLLSCQKQRSGEWEGTFGLEFEEKSLQFLKRHDRKAKEYV